MKKSYVYINKRNYYSISITEIIKFVLVAFFGGFGMYIGFLSLWLLFGY